MAVYRRPARSRFTLVLLVLSSVTLLTLDYRGGSADAIQTARDAVRDAFVPVQEASDRLFAPLGSLVGGVVHYGDLEAENDRLRREVADLRGAALRAGDADRERRALLDNAGLLNPEDVPRVEARVVATSPSNFAFTVEIDKGEGDGVATGMPVVTGSGLVGRIVQTSGRRSVVQLLTDKKFSVGVRLASSGDIGVADGQGRLSSLAVQLVDPTTEIPPDEVAVTSGLQQSRFPPGIPVGRVTSSATRPNALQQEVSLAPVVDLSRLSFVTVLQWSPG